ncbi:hypothetical protein F9817_11800 [Vibrio sp. CAIM 722]|uniref:Uncharacterized protein n=1 Tax=Vibrio eleionomae TaxID=2653505 RepID=A0A7X4RUH4_9VIBR|nr:hypothetical protein [Vibrio eleionomae]MZI93876.1 hypothetical protein [Vibrio eleionomae]
MPRFVRFLQLLFLIVVGCFLAYDFIFNGVNLFHNKYVLLSCGLLVLLELALWVIYKLIEDD